MTPRSARTFDWTSGRCTLTTTARPSFSVARWTWAREAAANGSGSIDPYSSSGSAPSSAGDDPAALSQGNGGTVLWSLSSSVRHSAGSASARLLDHLSELHVRRAELLEHQPHLGRRRHALDVAGRAALDPVAQPPHGRERGPAHEDLEAEARQRVVDLLETDVLDDRVAPLRRQPVDPTPDRPAARRVETRSVDAEERVEDRQDQREDQRIEDDPEQPGVGRLPRDLHQAGDTADQPEEQRVDDHDRAVPRLRRIQRPEIASSTGRTSALTSATTIPTWRTSGDDQQRDARGVPSGAVVGSCTSDSRNRVVIIASVLTRICTMNPRTPPPGRVASRTRAPEEPHGKERDADHRVDVVPDAPTCGEVSPGRALRRCRPRRSRRRR